MSEWLKNLWSDEAKFRAFLRGAVASAGVIVPHFVGAPEWVSLAVLAASQFIAAGDKNEQ